MVTVRFERDKRELSQEHKGSIRSLLQSLNVNPETVIVAKNGEIVAEDERCGEGDVIDVMDVVSGG